MQGAKTSKNMLPCWRHVHLHKSASFRLIFEKIQTNHKMVAKIDPETTEKTCRKQSKSNRKK